MLRLAVVELVRALLHHPWVYPCFRYVPMPVLRAYGGWVRLLNAERDMFAHLNPVMAN